MSLDGLDRIHDDLVRCKSECSRLKQRLIDNLISPADRGGYYVNVNFVPPDANAHFVDDQW